jgi:signal transduction histidine kinase
VTERHQTRRELADEQAALRRVATLVAQSAQPSEIFSAVCAEVGRLFGMELATIGRFENNPPAVVAVAVALAPGMEEVEVGSRWKLDDPLAATDVFESGRSVRADGRLRQRSFELAEALDRLGVVSTIASPILVESRLWGAVIVSSKEELPGDTEERLQKFTELVATAIANAESGEALARLVEEQAALRRVATLVAQGAAPAEVFAAVSAEADRVFHLDPATFDVAGVVRFEPGPELVVVGVSKSVEAVPLGSRFPPDELFAPTHVIRTERSARIRAGDLEAAGGEVADFLRHHGYLSQVASPIFIDGRLWGAISVNSRETLPPDTEERLEKFTELVGTAIVNAESHEALADLADEQAALRRVATLVARDAPSAEVFEAVAIEVGKLLDTDITVVGRYDGDGAATAIGSWSASGGGVPVGTRSAIGGNNVLTVVAETGEPARVDGYDDASGEAADIARRYGWRSSIAAPIAVEGRVWGVMLVATQREQVFPARAEQRLAAFTDLVATAVANAQAHDELLRFGEEQAALGRVATLVATGASPEQVFRSVVEEVSSLLGLERIELVRYDGDGTGTVIAASGDHPFPAGSTWSLDDPSVMAMVARTRRAARIDDYSTLEGGTARVARSAGFQSAIGAPITVEGLLWGVIIAISTDPEPIPDRSEARLTQFTEFVGTAVANAESRDALARIADEQATLRRIATLVARGVPPAEIFSAVSEEIHRLFGSGAAIVRFDHDAPALVFVSSSIAFGIPIGTRWEFQEGMSAAEVYRTGRSARVDGTEVEGPGRELGIVSSIATPIVVDGRLWGAVRLGSTDGLLPLDAEERLAKFTDLVATAIANAEGKSELAASRRRIVTATDDARRRIERDLHDGTQQRLVSLGLAVRAAEANVPPDRPDLRGELSRVAMGLADAVEDLQELSRGIHPAILARGGLGPALETLAHRSEIPVDLNVTTDARFPEPIEVAAYFVASEALANAAKHAQASRIVVMVVEREGRLLLSVRDDGVGGADPTRGSGLVGLTDRVEALSGSISVDSRRGSGTRITVDLPVEVESQQPAG